MKKVLLFALLTAALFSCKKEHVTPMAEASLSLAGSDLKFSANQERTLDATWNSIYVLHNTMPLSKRWEVYLFAGQDTQIVFNLWGETLHLGEIEIAGYDASITLKHNNYSTSGGGSITLKVLDNSRFNFCADFSGTVIWNNTPFPVSGQLRGLKIFEYK